MTEAMYDQKWSRFFRDLLLRPEGDDVAVFTPDRAKEYIISEICQAREACGGGPMSVGPFCLIGTSGVGKTQLVDQLQEELSVVFGAPVSACKITAPNSHPDDITGIPGIVNTDGKTEKFVIGNDERRPMREMGVDAVFISPITDRMAAAGIIFIDELNRVPTTHHLNSLMNIILSHEILGQRLSKPFVTIVAVNPDWQDNHLDVSDIEQGMAVRELDWAHRQRMLHRIRVVADVRPDIILKEMRAETEDCAGLAGHLARTFADWWNHDLSHLEVANNEGQRAKLNRMVSPRLLAAICRSVYWELKSKLSSPGANIASELRHSLKDSLSRKIRNFAVPIHPDDIRDESWESAITRLVRRLEGEGDVDLNTILANLDLIGYGSTSNGQSRFEPTKIIDALEYLLKSDQTVPEQLYPYGLIIAYLVSDRPWETLETSVKLEITERTQVMKGVIMSRLFRNVRFMKFLVTHLYDIERDSARTDPRGQNARFWRNMITELKQKAHSSKRLGDAEVYYSAIEEVVWNMCGDFSVIVTGRQKATARISAAVPVQKLQGLLEICCKDLLGMPSMSSDQPNYNEQIVGFWNLTARVNLKMEYDESEVDFAEMHEAHKRSPISPVADFPGENPEWTRDFFRKRPFEALAVVADRMSTWRPLRSVLNLRPAEEEQVVVNNESEKAVGV